MTFKTANNRDINHQTRMSTIQEEVVMKRERISPFTRRRKQETIRENDRLLKKI